MLAEKKTDIGENVSKSNFSLVDSSIINLIVEKTKLKKEKYSLILSKTIVVYVLAVGVCLFSYAYEIISKNVMGAILVFATLLLFIVYLFVIQHFNVIDKDLEEVVSLLQTKAAVKKNEKGHRKKHS